MKYENCWFEIKSFDRRMMLTRNHEDFVDRARVLARLHSNIALYRVENGRRSRIFSQVLFEEPGTQESFAFLKLGC